MQGVRLLRWIVALACSAAAMACSDDPEARPEPSTTAPAREEGNGLSPVELGAPIDVADLTGRIVFDDYEDVYTMRPDGSDVRHITNEPGAEFDGESSPDGTLVVYRDSRRGINEDDEVFVAHSDGSGARNLTNDPANDWGPTWSPDGRWIAFNSDRDGGPLSGYLVRPDGSGLRRLPIDGWVEYLAFSPDGTKVVYEGHVGSDYEVFVADLASGESRQVTDAPGDDGWPVWSPDGTAIAFTTERDDCLHVEGDGDCWNGDEPGEHRDVWLMDADGSNQRRITPEAGQFLAWSPDGRHLLVSGRSLYVIRPDGTGRVELRAEGMPLALGGIPDWAR